MQNSCRLNGRSVKPALMISFSRSFPVITLFAALSLHTQGADYFPPPDSAGGWRTATSAAHLRELAAMDLPRLEQAWEFTQRCTQNAGLLVVRNEIGRAHV